VKYIWALNSNTQVRVVDLLIASRESILRPLLLLGAAAAQCGGELRKFGNAVAWERKDPQ
jgi:hypothetical protein